MEIKIQVVTLAGKPYFRLAQGLRQQIHRLSEAFAHIAYGSRFLNAGFPLSGRGFLKTRRAVFKHDAGAKRGVRIYDSFQRRRKFFRINALRQFVEGG